MKQSITSRPTRSLAAIIPFDARRRLLEKGAEALSELELLALVLKPGTEEDAVLHQAARLLDSPGGVRDLARASFVELLRGVEPDAAASAVAALELGRRAVSSPVENRSSFRSSTDVFAHFRGRFSVLRKEVFYVILLDVRHRKVREVLVSEGSLTSSIVHPREVFAPAVRESAAAMILVHLHPSGDPSPSAEDVALTRRLREVGDIIGIKVLDHVIVGDGRHYSFIDAGAW